MLSDGQAVEIYRAKIAFHNAFVNMENKRKKISSSKLMRGRSVLYSRLYGVSSRTIRDIWNRRSWAFATQCMWWEEKESISCGQEMHFTDISETEVTPLLL